MTKLQPDVCKLRSTRAVHIVECGPIFARFVVFHISEDDSIKITLLYIKYSQTLVYFNPLHDIVHALQSRNMNTIIFAFTSKANGLNSTKDTFLSIFTASVFYNISTRAVITPSADKILFTPSPISVSFLVSP